MHLGKLVGASVLYLRKLVLIFAKTRVFSTKFTKNGRKTVLLNSGNQWQALAPITKIAFGLSKLANSADLFARSYLKKYYFGKDEKVDR